ncbi:MAG: serine/threonine-protein kinase [Myxococcota bacterium]
MQSPVTSPEPSPARLVGLEVRGVYSPRPALGKARAADTPIAFKLTRFVGAGKFAWVFEATAASGERVAVKLLTRDDTQAVRRFQREIKVMRELPDNPNCVVYKGHGVFEARAWVAMDFIDGFTLQAVVRSGKRLPERAACTLMAQLCAGFEGLHKLGLTHRDITPDNIMLTQADRQVKLMDFGLVQDSQGLLQLYEQADVLDGKDFLDDLDAGLIAGTPEFMAPEQILDPHEKDRTRQKTDTTADVFALGTIFFQLVAGAQLFPYERGARGASGKQGLINYLDYRVRLKDDDVVCPSDVGPELWSIIKKSLAREPKMRQRDATELGADIRYYLETGQGVLEDDMSATISHDFDLNRLRSMATPLTTGEFKTIQRAAQEAGPREPLVPNAARAPASAVSGPAAAPASARPPSAPAMRPSADGPQKKTVVEGQTTQSDPTDVDRSPPSPARVAAAEAAHAADEAEGSGGKRLALWLMLGAVVIASSVLVAFFLTKR